MARTNVPRASIGVSVLGDKDYYALVSMGTKGQAAFGVFCALIAAGKHLNNGGVFPGPLGYAAGQIHIKTRDLQAAIERIVQACNSVDEKPWIVFENNTLVIRSFKKWNSTGWGGARCNLSTTCSQLETQVTPQDTGIGIGDVSVTGFERFWRLWPKHKRKVGKSECQKFWDRERLELVTDDVIAGLDRWKRSQLWADDDGTYIPLPMTWLNKRRWNDKDLAERRNFVSAQITKPYVEDTPLPPEERERAFKAAKAQSKFKEATDA